MIGNKPHISIYVLNDLVECVAAVSQSKSHRSVLQQRKLDYRTPISIYLLNALVGGGGAMLQFKLHRSVLQQWKRDTYCLYVLTKYSCWRY